MPTAIAPPRRRRLAAALLGVGMAATLVAIPAVDFPGSAQPTAVASAHSEKVFNSTGSTRTIGVRVVWNGQIQEHLAGPGGSIQVGPDERITSFYCPTSTTCSYAYNGGPLDKKVRGPQRVYVPLGSRTTVFARL